MKSSLLFVFTLTMAAVPCARAEEASNVAPNEANSAAAGETIGTRIDATVQKVREGTAQVLEKTGDALKEAGTKTGEALEKAGNAVSEALKSTAGRVSQ